MFKHLMFMLMDPVFRWFGVRGLPRCRGGMGGQSPSPPSSNKCSIFHSIAKEILQSWKNYSILKKNLLPFLHQFSDIRSRLCCPCRTAHILCHNTIFYTLLNGSDDRSTSLVLPDMIEQQRPCPDRSDGVCHTHILVLRCRTVDGLEHRSALRVDVPSRCKSEPPLIIAPRSVMMSPNMLGVTTTSNHSGFLTNHMVMASTNVNSVVTSGYFFLVSVKTSRQSPYTSDSTFALSTDVSFFFRACARSNA